jgi:hypothetical protein
MCFVRSARLDKRLRDAIDDSAHPLLRVIIMSGFSVSLSSYLKPKPVCTAEIEKRELGKQLSSIGSHLPSSDRYEVVQELWEDADSARKLSVLDGNLAVCNMAF